MSRDFEVFAPYEETKVTALTDVDGGAFLSSGNVNGIVINDWVAGNEITLVHKASKARTYVKKTGEDWLAGDRLYYDAGANKLTKFEQAKFAGFAFENAATNDTEADFILEGILTPDSFKSTGDTFLTRKLIQSESDFLPAVGGKIQLENFLYVIDGNVDVDHPLVFPASGGCKLSSTAIGGISVLRYTDTGNMFEGTLSSDANIVFDGLECNAGLGTLFSVTGVPNARIGIIDSEIIGGASCGSIVGTIFSLNFSAVLGMGAGFVFNNCPLLSFTNSSMADWQNNITTMLDFDGTMFIIELINMKFDPEANESVLNFPVTLTLLTEAKIIDSTFFANPFAASSRNQTDPSLNFQNSPGVDNSMITGSFYINGNGLATTFSKLGVDGTITAFSDAGGGKVLCASTLAGLANGESVCIKDNDDYQGTYVIESVVAGVSFNITKAFVATGTAIVEVGWEVIKSTLTTAGTDIERCELLSGNRLQFKNLSSVSISINFHLSAITANAAIKNYEFAVFKNGYRIQEAKTPGGIGDVSINLGYSATIKVIATDIVEIRARNLTNLTETIVSNVQFINQ